MLSVVKATTKKGAVNPHERNHLRVRRLIRRMVLSEFSAPPKATMKDYESLTEYRRVE
jgi:hypothetical protein